MYSVFFQILSSWEVIVTILVILVILPLTFYITAQHKSSSYHYIGISKTAKTSKKKVAGKTTDDKDKKGDTKNDKKGDKKDDKKNDKKDDRRREREEQGENNENNDDDEDDRTRYEVLKRLKGQK